MNVQDSKTPSVRRRRWLAAGLIAVAVGVRAAGRLRRLPRSSRQRREGAFSETDLTDDLTRFDIPTLIAHGDDGQIVPIGASARRSAELVEDATLKVYPGAPHGLFATHRDRFNADLLAFLRA